MCNLWAARVKFRSSANTMTACRWRTSTLANTTPYLLCQTAEIGYCPTSSQGTGRKEKVLKELLSRDGALSREGGRLTLVSFTWHAFLLWPSKLLVGLRPSQMSSRELSPEWVLSSFISPLAGSQDEISELVVVARRLWPRIQAHARREQPEKSSDEALGLATEVWEGVLQSVAKTIQRSNRRNWRIKNTEAYLFGAFHHRFNRALKKERTRRETIQCIPSIDLERLRQSHDSKAVRDLEETIQVNEAVRSM